VKPSFVQPRVVRPQGGSRCSWEQTKWRVYLTSPGYSVRGNPIIVIKQLLALINSEYFNI